MVPTVRTDERARSRLFTTTGCSRFSWEIVYNARERMCGLLCDSRVVTARRSRASRSTTYKRSTYRTGGNAERKKPEEAIILFIGNFFRAFFPSVPTVTERTVLFV